MSSFAGSSPSPMLATYSGSKAFLQTWSQALGKEVESKGITVSLVNAFFVVRFCFFLKNQHAILTWYRFLRCLKFGNPRYLPQPQKHMSAPSYLKSLYHVGSLECLTPLSRIGRIRFSEL